MRVRQDASLARLFPAVKTVHVVLQFVHRDASAYAGTYANTHANAHTSTYCSAHVNLVE